MNINWPEVIRKFDEKVALGFCIGVGKPDGQVCVEAAITQALGLPFNDEPECVSSAVRRYKIRLNDSPHWKSPQSRAEALRDIGIAQIGSKGVVDNREFAALMAKKTIKFLLPEIPTRNEKLKTLLLVCGQLNIDAPLADFRRAAYAAAADDAAAAYAAAAYAAAAYADVAAAAAAYAAAAYADAAYAAAAADAAAYAAYAAADPERFLRLSASLALETLRELKSPGCAWIPERSL